MNSADFLIEKERCNKCNVGCERNCNVANNARGKDGSGIEVKTGVEGVKRQCTSGCQSCNEACNNGDHCLKCQATCEYSCQGCNKCQICDSCQSCNSGQSSSS